MVSLYAPTHGKDEEYLECLSYLAEFILENMSESDSLLIGADTNCSIKSSNRRQKAWDNFCQNFSLTTHTGPAPTFHHHNGTSNSFIDSILTSSNLKPSRISQLCTLDNPLNLSSHDVLSLSLSVPLPQTPASKYEHTYKKFNRKRVVWREENLAEYQELSSSALSDALEFWDAPEFIPLLCSLFSNLLVKSAELVFEIKQTKKAKYTEVPVKVRAAEKDLKNKHNNWKKSGRPQDKQDPSWQKYATARANLQGVTRWESDKKTRCLNNYLMRSDKKNQKHVFSKLRQLRNTKTKSTTSFLNSAAGQYYGNDVLEGFAADAEFLGKPTEENDYFDKEFYELCVLDNLYIFDFKGEEPVKIPSMTIDDLDKIIDKKMKLKKSCDIYQLTVEHLRFCGKDARASILKLMNRIIKNIYYLTCPQIKIVLGSALYKGRSKPVSSAKSYRRITVTPQIGSILDRFIDPIAEKNLPQSPEP